MTTRIGRARQALRDACVGGETPADRVHLWPQMGQYPTPCAWVGLPVVRSARGATSLTIPVIVLVDGNAEAQMEALDDELSRIWDALRKVRPDGLLGPLVEVVSAVPDVFGPEGSSTRGVTFTCQIELATLTLCDAQPLVDPS